MTFNTYLQLFILGVVNMKVKRIIQNLAFFSLFVFPLISHAEYDKEVKFGFYADRFFISTHTILFDEVLNKRITEIGNRVAKVSDKPDMEYTFRIVNDPVINAYSTAGGYVYINTGLLDVLESEDELAAVLGHEIVHTNKSHQINFARAMHRGEVVGIAIAVLLSSLVNVGAQAAMGPSTPETAFSHSIYEHFTYPEIQRLAGEVGGGIAISIVQGYGKKQELEADVLAIQYIKKAGYDPNAMISVLKRMISVRNRLKINENNYVSKLINAEPGLEERIKNAELILNSDKNKQMK